MIELDIPGRGVMKLEHLVIDVEGTLSVDGRFNEELKRPLLDLRDRLQVHLLTVDPFQQLAWLDRQLGIRSQRLHSAIAGDAPESMECAQKAAYIQKIGSEQVVAIGQGADDAAMLKAAALGICVISPEGASVETLLAADLVVSNVLDALMLLIMPMRIVSSLRR